MHMHMHIPLAMALALAFVLLVILSYLEHFAKGEPQVPCYFILGDSLVDSGNNNLLPTLAKSNFPPYGIDFPTGSTGRFTSGRTSQDLIGELMGFDNYMLPFDLAWKSDILKGVNYASGSAGILDETGTDTGEIISLNRQLIRHELVVAGIITRLGDKDSAVNYLNKCLYSVVIGSNDYIRNYFSTPLSPTSLLYTPDQFAALLIQQYSLKLRKLHDLGARKVALFGLAKIGCTPNAVATHPRNGSVCIENMNNAVHLFNNGLKSLVDELNNQTTDAKFIYINIFGIASDNTTTQGFRVRDAPCCKVINNGACIAFQTPCKNRSEHAFWDGFHPTEAMNRVVAQRSYHALYSSDAYPFDISHLISL